MFLLSVGAGPPLVTQPDALNQVYNVAAGQGTTLNMLHTLLGDALRRTRPDLVIAAPHHADFRLGDVRHSLADIGKARRLLDYEPTHSIERGLESARLPIGVATTYSVPGVLFNAGQPSAAAVR